MAISELSNFANPCEKQIYQVEYTIYIQFFHFLSFIDMSLSVNFQSSTIRNDRGDISIDTKDTKKIIKNYEKVTLISLVSYL